MKIRGEGFVLRIINVEDDVDYFRLIEENRKRLKNYFPKTVLAVQSLKTAQSHLIQLKEKYSKKEMYPFGVFKNNKLIGWISIKNIDWRIPKGELGYYIDQASEGQGIMSKAVAAISKFAFDNLEMEKLYIHTALDNHASKKIAFKNDFKQEGLHRKEFRIASGELIDTVYLGRLKDY